MGKENNKYDGQNEIFSARNGVTGLFARLRADTLQSGFFGAFFVQDSGSDIA